MLAVLTNKCDPKRTEPGQQATNGPHKVPFLCLLYQKSIGEKGRLKQTRILELPDQIKHFE
jgi:hypothetical protein